MPLENFMSNPRDLETATGATAQELKKRFSLGKLEDANFFHDPIDLGDEDSKLLVSQLYEMVLIRATEEKIGQEVEAKNIACPCHLAIGQEAIPVAMGAFLRKTDRVFGTHRSHGHYLAQGGSLEGLLAEVLGKSIGCSKGMGGSMHLYSGETGFYGSVPIVSATVSLAVGAALAAQKKKTTDVAVAYFGDGAIEEGAVHESLNFAATFRLPIIFVCENNLFSSHLHISLRQPASSVARFAQAHCLDYEVVDGNDLAILNQVARRFVDQARSGKGASFIEAVTYRWRGHVGFREDIDVGVKRNDDLTLWKRRDPIARLVTSLQERGALSFAEFEKMQMGVRKTVEDAWNRALSAPYPEENTLLNTVYFKKN